MVKGLSLACPAAIFRSVPAGAGDREGNLGQARIGLAVPGKAIGKHRHTLDLPVPFAAQDGPRPDVGRTPGQVHGVPAGFLWRLRAIEQPLTIAIQVPQGIGLKPVRQHAEQEMARQVRGRSPSEYGVPTGPKRTDVEIAQARNLDVECLPVWPDRSLRAA